MAGGRLPEPIEIHLINHLHPQHVLQATDPAQTKTDIQRVRKKFNHVSKSQSLAHNKNTTAFPPFQPLPANQQNQFPHFRMHLFPFSQRRENQPHFHAKRRWKRQAHFPSHTHKKRHRYAEEASKLRNPKKGNRKRKQLKDTKDEGGRSSVSLTASTPQHY